MPRPPRDRRGFTLAEISIATGLFLTILVVVGAIGSYIWRSFYQGVATSEAMRSASTTLQWIEADLQNSRMFSPADLRVDQRTASFTLTLLPPVQDPLRVPEEITYSLKEQPGRKGLYRLLRNGRTLGSVLLEGLSIGWGRRPGQLVLEMAATDGNHRVVHRIRRSIDMASLSQRRTFQGYFPEVKPVVPGAQTVQADGGR